MENGSTMHDVTHGEHILHSAPFVCSLVMSIYPLWTLHIIPSDFDFGTDVK